MCRINLANCFVLLLFFSGLIEFAQSAVKCTPGKARLVNGTSENQGVFEICLADSTWSTVCMNSLSCNVYKVACRQAGFDNNVQSASNYTAFRLSKPKVGFYSCTGIETSLSSCTVQTRYTIETNCGSRVLSLTCTKSPDEKCTTENDIRLYGGSKKSEGQLQICKNKEWREVCDRSSDSQALGYVACRQLGYTGNLISTTHQRHFYNSSFQPYAYTRVRCHSRNSAKVSYCSVYSDQCYYNCPKQEVAVSCVPDKANCQQNDIRLFGGRNKLEGWLEVCVNGVWGRVNGKIEGRAPNVICSTLDFNDQGAERISHWTAQYSYKFKPTISPITVKGINCCDKDKTFGTCDIHLVEKTDTSFSVNNDIAIACKDGCTYGKMRLKGGTTKHEGTVEMCASGTWKAIGLSQWDDVDANVVCQHLYPGQKYAYAIATNSTEFVASSRGVIYNNVRCNGAETSINSCSKSYFATTTYTGPTAAVRCHPVCNCKTAA